MPEYQITPQLNELIKAVYHGPLEEQPWQMFLRLFRGAVKADFATLLLRPPKPGDPGVVYNAVVHSPEAYQAYNENYFALDSFVNLPHGKVVTLGEYMDEKTLRASEYFKRYMKPIDVYYVMGADLTDQSGMNVRLRVTRNQQAGDFDQEDKRICELILPHLLQSIELNAQLRLIESERGVFENAIDQLSMGSIILDEQGAVVRVNQVAQAILDENKGIKIANHRLVLIGHNDNRQLQELITTALVAYSQRTPGYVKAIRVGRDHSSSLGLLIRPMPQTSHCDDLHTPAVSIFISDPDRKLGAPDHILNQLFDFTPAESKLALLLANGLTLEEASSELDVSRNTAKSHLSAIFSKTGVSRQTKLVQLILNSVAPMG